MKALRGHPGGGSRRPWRRYVLRTIRPTDFKNPEGYEEGQQLGNQLWIVGLCPQGGEEQLAGQQHSDDADGCKLIPPQGSSSSDDADAASSPPPDSYALHIDTSTLVGESSTALDSPTSPSLMAEKDFHAQKSASLLRLGMLMAFTMTLHNLPEGFAVAFSALTDFGPIMAIAIAVHNIPEGIIIAAPIYAATGSRLKALGLATASVSFAVAFSALTDFGPIMAIAIAVHNIPEGIIIAAPIYAATGSRLNALGLATASGFAVAFSALTDLSPIMAIAIAVHNIPEGIIIAAPIYAATGSCLKALGLATASVSFAVAFSALTGFGPIMAIAIAVHNIPEGIIIAAPIYAATGSRLKALGLATASGLSEPLGAFIALVALKSFLTQERLHYLLAFLAVCVIELWPEARSCKNDRGLAWGIAIGSVVMAWTLYVGT
eukprot:gene20760-27581_t